MRQEHLHIQIPPFARFFPAFQHKMSEEKSKLVGHLAAAGAYAIFGINIVINKDVANSGVVTPIAMFTFRAVGAAILFWLISAFMPKEKVALQDMWKIALASFVGLFVPQLTFLKAITVTTSIDTSILGSLTPVFTMFIAALVLKEPVSFKKAFGVMLSFAGVLILIYNSVHFRGGVEQTQPLGVVLLLVNTLSFATYLGVFKPLIARYSVVTFMKWMFLFSVAMSLPFSAGDIVTMDYASIRPLTALEIGFVIFFATFVAYFLIPVGQKRIRPTLVGMYTYLQPMIAVIISIVSGLDVITPIKVAAGVMAFAGVVIVNGSRAAKS